MAKQPEIAKIIKWFAERNIKEEVARKWYAHYAKIGWENLAEPYKALESWVDHARPSDYIVRPKDLTPKEPLARGQPTLNVADREPERSPEYEEHRRAAVERLKGFKCGKWGPEHLCFLFGLLSTFRTYPNRIMQAHNVSKPMMAEVRELSLLVSSYKITKEEYL